MRHSYRVALVTLLFWGAGLTAGLLADGWQVSLSSYYPAGDATTQPDGGAPWKWVDYNPNACAPHPPLNQVTVDGNSLLIDDPYTDNRVCALDIGDLLQQLVGAPWSIYDAQVTYQFAVWTKADGTNINMDTHRSAEFVVGVPQTADPRCTFPTGDRSVSIFPTALQMTGSMGAGSRARLDFQLASPGSPITTLAIKDTAGLLLASMAGSDLTALAGMWFTVPPTGTYRLVVSAGNAYGCVQTDTTRYQFVVP